MEILLWITLCLFACVGFVQAVAWLICSGRGPLWRRIQFRLIPLESERPRIDAQLEHCVLQVAWGSWEGRNLLFLAQSGTEEYVQKRVLSLFGEGCRVFVCGPGELERTVAHLADLQKQ